MHVSKTLLLISSMSLATLFTLIAPVSAITPFFPEFSARSHALKHFVFSSDPVPERTTFDHSLADVSALVIKKHIHNKCKHHDSDFTKYGKCIQKRVADYKSSPTIPFYNHVITQLQHKANSWCNVYNGSTASRFAKCLLFFLENKTKSFGCTQFTMESVRSNPCMRPKQTTKYYVDRHGIHRIVREPVTLLAKELNLSEEEIRLLQQSLNVIGIDVGPEDGVWGEKTAAGFRKFLIMFFSNTDRSEISVSHAIRYAQLEAMALMQGLDRDYTASLTTDTAGMPDDIATKKLSPQQVYKRVASSVHVIVSTTSNKMTSLGSAVAVTNTTLITNCHILEGHQQSYLVKNKQTYKLTIERFEAGYDRCLVRVFDTTLNPIDGVRRLSDVEIGETVFSIGSPKGFQNTFAQGIVSGKRRMKNLDLIQTTAPLSQGSSGGALVDEHGNLIGITTATLESSQNMNFAIPAASFWDR